MIFTFAGMQASSGAKLWHPQYLQPIGYVYAALLLFAGYCVFRGLYGEWWMVVKIDLEARALKTCKGEVVSLDALGTLTADKTALRATGAKTPVYLSSTTDVKQVHAMLEELVRP